MKQNRNNFAFIDSQNLNLAIRNQGWILDWKKFRQYLSDKYNVGMAYLFIGYVAGNEPFYNSLSRFGYFIVFKPTLKLPDGSVNGNVDAELVLYAMIEYSNYNKAVIVTGDGDFYCLVEYLADQDKLHKLLIPNGNKYSSLLRRFAKQTHYINELRGKLGNKNEKSP